MPRPFRPAAAATFAVRADAGARDVALRGGLSLVLALAGLMAVASGAEAASPQGGLLALLAAALVVGAGGIVANFVGLTERAAAADKAEAAPAPQEAPAAGLGEPIGDLRILVAEADPLNQLLVHALLNGLVASLTIASDGVEALESMRRQDFDLVLMDVDLPHLDGLSALAAIRAGRAGRRDTSVAALTRGEEAADRLYAAGFDGCLAKPFRPADLLAVVADCAARAPAARRAAA
ncbi:MAG: response regulator [Phenylobacterium sp.]|nr:response regulator [Phenylobacterium sp.]